MNKQFIDAHTVERCATALKEIYDNTNHGFNKLPVHIVFNSHQVPYYTLLPRVMQEQSIITKGKTGVWSWVTTTEPNIKMAEALLNACKLAGKRYNTEYIARKPKPVVEATEQGNKKTSSTDVHHIICNDDQQAVTIETYLLSCSHATVVRMKNAMLIDQIGYNHLTFLHNLLNKYI